MKHPSTFEEAVTALLEKLTESQKRELVSLPFISSQVAIDTDFFNMVIDSFGLDIASNEKLLRDIARSNPEKVVTDDFLGDISIADPNNGARLILEQAKERLEA